MVGLRTLVRLGDARGDEAEQRGPPGLGRLDHVVPAGPGRPRELVRALGAHIDVRVARLVVPGLDPADEPAARRDDLRPALEHLAVELDLPERARDPVGQVARTARVHAALALHRVRLDPLPRLGPRKAAEDAATVGTEELVSDHARSQSRKAW